MYYGIGILLYYIGHLYTALTYRYHSAEIIMHCSTDNTPDGNCQKCYRAEQYSLYGSEYRSRTRYVQKIDKGILLFGHRYVINTVISGECRCFPVVGSEHVLAKMSVQSASDNEYDQSHNKGMHICFPLHNKT